MIEKTIAHPSTESTTDPRVLRGRRLYHAHSDQILWKRGTWYVPSENGCQYYAVRLGPAEVCECSDYEHRGLVCKHIYCARLAHAKSAVCSCCGHRVLNLFLSEVVEEDELLGWFVGDMLCADCCRAGYCS